MQGKIALEEHVVIEPTLGDSQVFGANVWPELRHRLIDVQAASLTVSQISAPRRCCDWSIAAWTSRQASDERADQPSTHGCD